MMTLQEASQKIKARELAIENDGNNEALKKCLEYFWPNDKSASSYVGSVYGQSINYINEWTTRFLGGSQSIPATELAALIDAGETKEWMPIVGEIVEVRDCEGDKYESKLFYVGKNKKGNFVCENEGGYYSSWKFCRPIQKQKIKLSELFEKSGITLAELLAMADISKEALLNKAGLNQSEWEVVSE